MQNSKTALLRRIHGFGKRLGMDHEALTIAACRYEVDSLSQLTVLQLKDFLSWLIEKTGQVNAARTWSAQDKRIFALGYDLKWDTIAIRRFLKHQTGKTDMKKLTLAEKSKVIIGMEKIKKGEN